MGLGWVGLGRELGRDSVVNADHSFDFISRCCTPGNVNAFKARLDKIWLHQAVKCVSCIGLGRTGCKFFHF